MLLFFLVFELFSHELITQIKKGILMNTLEMFLKLSYKNVNKKLLSNCYLFYRKIRFFKNNLILIYDVVKMNMYSVAFTIYK